MFSKTFMCAGVALCLTAIAFSFSPAFGHHSFAMFDQTHAVEVSGTVTRFDWLNPHSWLYIATTDENGNDVAWGFETSSPSGLASTGWRSDSVRPGDRVVVVFYPMKDGTNGGQLRTITLPDGTELCNGAECREAYGVTE